jgi:hypothetical protein
MIIVLGSYYVNLYLSKDSFTKEELKEVMPYMMKLWNKISNNYSMSVLLISLCVASLIGIMLAMLSQHWFLNSAILFVVMFFVFPLAKKNFDSVMITTGGTFSDTAMSIFVKYHSIILVGFGTGTATGLMYNWGVYKSINFLWFLVNIIVMTILIGMCINEINNQ